VGIAEVIRQQKDRVKGKNGPVSTPGDASLIDQPLLPHPPRAGAYSRVQDAIAKIRYEHGVLARHI